MVQRHQQIVVVRPIPDLQAQPRRDGKGKGSVRRRSVRAPWPRDGAGICGLCLQPRLQVSVPG